MATNSKGLPVTAMATVSAPPSHCPTGARVSLQSDLMRLINFSKVIQLAPRRECAQAKPCMMSLFTKTNKKNQNEVCLIGTR